MTMYSALTGFSSRRELHANTLGAGIFRTFLTCDHFIGTVAGQSKDELRTKSIVAISLAVVRWGRPALGFGTFAMTSFPSFIVRRKVY